MIEVIADFDVIGFHSWPDAIDEVRFLSASHRHVFRIRAGFPVEHRERQVEIFLAEQTIRDFIGASFAPYLGGFDFGHSSCESIASAIVGALGCAWCEVLEDGRGGARVTA